MKNSKILSIFFICIYFFITVIHSFAQNNASANSEIAVAYGTQKLGAPYTFSVISPANTVSVKFSVSEFNGNVIYSEQSENSQKNVYIWLPSENTMLQSSIYYIATFSFLDANGSVPTDKGTKILYSHTNTR